ncbi:MAG TPA: hypothetical protein VGJ14_14300 [Sporichthyaceae bacterium]|jgi:hypothetical protein
MSTKYVYQVLWHRVFVEIDGGSEVPVTPMQWPVEPIAEAPYRLRETDAGWALNHQQDLVSTAPDLASALATLDRRVGATALDLAARRGWVAFRGAVVQTAAGRLCIVGDTDQVCRAAGTVGMVESLDGWVCRDGAVLAAPFRGAVDVAALALQPVDRILQAAEQLTYLDSPAAALAALVASGNRALHPAPAIVRAATHMLRPRSGASL